MDKIKQAYDILSTLSASGDALDVLAAVRSLLREAMKEAEDGRQTDRESTGSGKR